MQCRSMVEKVIILVLLGFLGLWDPPQVHAKDSSYIIGVETTRYFPLYDHDGSEYIGFAREFFDEFSRQSGVKLQFRILPVKRLYFEFLKNNSPLDFKFPDSPEWARELKQGQSIHYSTAMVEYIDGLMVLPENRDMKLENLLYLGTQQGFTAWSYLSYIESGKIRLSESNNYISLLKKVLFKHVDAAYSNIAVAQYQLREVLKKPNALVFHDKLPYTRSSYFLSSIKHPEMIAQFNQFIAVNQEKLNELKLKYEVTVQP